MTAHQPQHAAGPTVAPDRVQSTPRRPSVTVGVTVVVAVLLAVVAVGAFLPGVPWLGQIGTAASAWAPWLVVAGLVVTVVATIALMRRGSVTRVVAVVAGLVVTGSAFAVVTLQLRVAQEHGVSVQIAELFRLTPGDIEPDLDAQYGDEDGEPQNLSLWLPEGADDGAPVVVLVHGGGWVSGDRQQTTTASHAAWFAAQGYLAVSIDYPLSGDDRHLWDVVEPQVACALVWVDEHAADHGGDASRVYLTGDSAGGNLALDVAYRSAAGDVDPACDGTVPPVRAVSTLYPVASPTGMYDNTDRLLGPTGRDMLTQYTGGSPQDQPQRYAAITPAEHASAAAPATLMVVGAADHLVPPAGAEELAEQLTRLEVPNDLVELPAAGHVFDAAPGGVGTQVWRELTLQLFTAS